MAMLNYQVSADELDVRLIEVLKNFFRGEEIVISVQRLSPGNKNNGVTSSSEILAGQPDEVQESKVTYDVPGETFDQLADRFLENEDFDIMSELSKYKVVTP